MSQKMQQEGFYHAGYQQNYATSKIGCCTKVMKVMLGFINSLALIGALLTFIIGALAYWGQSVLSAIPYVGAYLSLATLLLDAAGLVLMCYSAVVLLITVIACCGVTCCVRALIVYCVILAVLLVALIVVAIVYSQSATVQSAFFGTVQSAINASMLNYQDPFMQAQFSTLLNAIANGNVATIIAALLSYFSDLNNLVNLCYTLVMELFQCCGIFNYTDYQVALTWQRTYAVPSNLTNYQAGAYILSLAHANSTSNAITSVSYVNKTMVVPFGCCAFSSYNSVAGTSLKLPNVAAQSGGMMFDCVFNPNSSNSYIAQQCFITVYQQIAAYVTNPLIVACVVTGALLVIPLSLAAAIVSNSRQQYDA